MTPLIRIEGVSRAFGSVRALDDVSLEIRENEFFALLGPSGCGKTTLLRILAGFEGVDAGRVLLGDSDLLAIPAHRRPVNLMFQSYALFPHMSVEGNVAYGLAREGRPKDEIRARVADVLRTVGIPETAKRRPSQLSGGQRQRVALARAIVKRPRLLLLDEPLSALDRKAREEMQMELKRLQHEVGITFVVVTHDQGEAMSLADRIAVLNTGRVEQVDAPVALYQRPATLFVARFLGANNLIAGTAAPEGLAVPGLGVLPADAAGVPAGAGAWLAVRPESLRLAPDAGLLRATVAETQFGGGTSTLALTIAGLGSPLLAAVSGPPPFTRGDAVGVGWDPGAAHLLPEPAAAPSAGVGA